MGSHLPKKDINTDAFLQSTTNKMQRFLDLFISINFSTFQAVPPPIIRSTKLYI